ncbi:MAG: PAS domain S-box protein [Bacteroidota bacterium]
MYLLRAPLGGLTLRIVTPTDPTSPTVSPGHLDGFLPADLEPHERRRGRLLVGFAMLAIGGYAAALLPLGWLGWTWSFAAVGIAALTTLVALGGLRRQAWGPALTGWIVFFTLILTLFGVAWADMGLGAPELLWATAIPITAALVGGRRLATVCAIGITLGAVVLGIRGGLVPFPQTAPEALVRAVAMMSLAGVAVAGAILGQIYQRSVRAALDEQRSSLTRLSDALRQSEARYRTAIENVPVGIAQSTVDGRLALVNPAFAKIFGYESVDELRASGASAYDFYAHEADRQRLLDHLASGADDYVTEMDGVDRHGRSLRLRFHVRPRRGSSGTVLGIEGVVEDITAVHEATERLRENEARFRALVQRSSDVVIVADREGRLTYASPSIGPLLGHDPMAMLGQSVFEFLHPDDQGPGRALFGSLTDASGGVPPTEFRLRHAEGHYVFAEGVGTPLFDDPAIGGLVVNFRDVTDRKRAEAVLVHAKEQAEEVAQLKSTFLANMSHEIRTPLTGILGFADILADEVTDPQQKEFVDLIERSGRRLLDTLNSVLDLAKLDAGGVELGAAPVSLAEAARETARLLEPLATEKGLTLNADVQDAEAIAEIDRGALDRILTNLVGNAIKFTDEGEVRIVVRSTETRAILDVVDTGVGIAPEFLPRLFEEFQQESSGAAREHEGSGLGLAITRQLAERMDGHVSVESQKGVGTTFTVEFPHALVPEVVPEQRRARVLVVDDNAQTLRMAERMIEATYRVDTADGAEGAERLAQAAAQTGDSYDIFLLDINLGTMDTGEDVMRRLRQMAPYHERPIVAFTAYALPGDRERFLAGGFDGYFSKPFTRETLLTALAEALERGCTSPQATAASSVPTPSLAPTAKPHLIIRTRSAAEWAEEASGDSAEAEPVA